MRTTFPIPAARDRAEALLLALVGIEDACVMPASNHDSALEVRVVPAPGQSQGQVTRNVTSAIFAGLGLRLLPLHIQFVNATDLAGIRAARAAEETAVPETVAAPPAAAVPSPASLAAQAAHRAPAACAVPAAVEAPVQTRDAVPAGAAAHADGARANGGNGNGGGNGTGSINGHARSGNGAVNGAGHSAARFLADDAPHGASAATVFNTPRSAVVPTGQATGPTLLSITMNEQGERIRCHVTVALSGRILAGAGEAPAVPGQAIDLAGRVTTEAVRGATHAAATLQFTGATRVQIAGRTHTVVALQQWRDGNLVPLAGAAPVRDSEEHAAAEAVLGALRELF